MSDTNKKYKYYQQSALTLRILKYITIFALIVFLISCIVIFRKDITVENIQLLAKFINFDGSASAYTEEFSVTADDDSNVIMLRNNLGIINHNNISLYDLSGQKLFSYNFSLSSPAVVNDDHSIIVHDIEGNTLTIFNSFSKIKDFKYTGNVLSANVNDNYFSVITQDESFNSLLNVYSYNYHDRDYIDVYTLKSSDFLTSSAVTHNGRYIIASSADSNEGSYNSYVCVYDTASSSTEPLYRTNIPNELPIKSGFADDNSSSYVITDSAVHFFNDSLDNTHTYKFNQSKVENFYEKNNLIIFTERNNLSGNSVMLVAMNKYGNSLFNVNISDEVYDICIGKNTIFALGKKSVYRISEDKNNNYQISGKFDLSSKYFHIVCDTDDNCYILDDLYVKKVDFGK